MVVHKLDFGLSSFSFVSGSFLKCIVDDIIDSVEVDCICVVTKSSALVACFFLCI